MPTATRAPRRRREAARIAGYIAVAVSVWVAAVVISFDLRHRADRERRAQVLVADIAHDVDAVRFFPATYLYGQPISPGAVAQEEAHAARLRAHAAALVRLAPSATAREIAFQAGNVADQGTTVMHLMMDAAGVSPMDFNARVLQPAADDLAQIVPVEERRIEAAAAKDKRHADRTSLLLGLVVVSVNLLLLFGSSRSRRRVERLEAEQIGLRDSTNRLTALLTNSSDLIMVIGTDVRVSYVSPAIVHVLGYRPDEFVGRTIDEFVHPDDVARLSRPETNFGKTNETRWRHRDGTWRDVESVYADMVDDPLVGGYVVNARDVTARHALERELRRSQKLESVGQLASGIAHEINTPVQFVGDNVRFFQEAFDKLFSLVGFYRAALTPVAVDPGEITAAEDAAELGYFAAEVPRALHEALDGIDRIATIVRAMRSFGHPDGAEQAPADINECIRDTLVVATNEIKHVARVETDLDDLPPVTCFRGDVNQVLLNLLVNAAHAIAQRRRDGAELGTISVGSRVEGDEVVISVSDTGCGIDDGIRDRVFDQFFTTKDVGRGTGQGLALARTVVLERHHGSLTFDTTPGVGTTFYVRLPISGLAPREEREWAQV